MGSDYETLTCGYTWTMPRVQRIGSVQYSPYGPAWDDGVDENGRAEYRAQPSLLELSIGAVDAISAIEAVEVWTQRVLAATRLQFLPTGRFMELLLTREVGERQSVRGTFYRVSFQLEYQNPYWHEDVGDGSTRMHP